MMDRFRIGVHCTRGVGPTRGGRANNEDNYLVAHRGRVRYLDGGAERELRTETGAGLMVAVADGMGGHDNGALASAAAVQALVRLYERGRPRDPADTLLRFVHAAHTRLKQRATTHGLANMGTTLTVLWIVENDAYWVHVGDSRLYLMRGGGLSQLSRDHTREEFARRDGRPIPSQPRSLSQNFLYGSRGLGNDAGIRIDAGVDTGHFALRPHDRLLLCSDGLVGGIRHDRLANLLQPRSEQSPQETAQTLARSAMESGSEDNITAVLVHVDDTLHLESGAGWRLFDEPPTEPRLPHRRDD